MQIVIVGAGSHAMVVGDALLSAGAAELIAFVGETADGAATLLDVPVLRSLDDLPLSAGMSVVIAIGNNEARQRELRQARARGLRLVNVFHPSAVASARCTIADGVMMMAGAVVNVAAEIGENVILNTACSVDHHCRVGAHSHLAPGVTLAGTARVGELTLVGAGAVILPGITVGDRCTIGAGAVVTRSVPSGCTAVGVPARVIRHSGA
jgi:sugar O-acyltransferase (sialic acid O-acetyltransferase NeuD family)